MGRHSSPSQGHFYRSVAAWLLPWLALAGVLGVVVWLGVRSLGQDELETAPPASSSPATVRERARPSPAPAVPRAKSAAGDKLRASRRPKLITAGVSVQVLNGTVVTDANDRLAQRLEDLGYEVVNLDGANRAFAETVVFWSSPSARRAARALAAHFGWAHGPKPDNLSSSVDLHVVVGADEA